VVEITKVSDFSFLAVKGRFSFETLVGSSAGKEILEE
jgi:hypothetical protein